MMCTDCRHFIDCLGDAREAYRCKCEHFRLRREAETGDGKVKTGKEIGAKKA